MKNILLLIISLCFLQACSKSDETPIFLNDWDEDIYYFGKNLEENHKDLFHNISAEVFRSKIENLRSQSGELAEHDIIINLLKILRDVGDSHTLLDYGGRLTNQPVGFDWFSDGIYITSISEQLNQHLGQKVERINDIPIQTVIDSFTKVIPHENMSKLKTQMVQHLKHSELYDHFGFGTNALLLNMETSSGEKIQLPDLTNNIVRLEPNETALYLSNLDNYYWSEVLEDDGIFYVQYNRCREDDFVPFDDFVDEFQNQVNDFPNVKKLVFDLRLNGGGNSGIAEPLLNSIENFVESGRFLNSDVYVVIGRRTFSSAVLNTLQIQERIEPVLIGEPSGGKPNHYGEIRNFTLPNSRLKVYYSTKYFEYIQEDPDAIYPDIEIINSIDDYKNGVDPVMEKIKRL